MGEDELKINSKTGFESELFGDYLKPPEIYQKVKLKVDENGAEGAAATVTAVSTRSWTKPREYIVDRPFFFFIKLKCPDSDTLFDGKNSRFAGFENIDGSPMDEQDECFFD